tara:strand:- start:1028 stop:1438 length:411 start_codon:yes stop_codon:yes gene_type:complete
MKTTTVQNIFRIVLGLAMTYAGVTHLTVAREEFQAQVPTWVPIGVDLVVILSGIVEIGLGLGMVFLKKYRAQVGLALALFYVLIFPGNIAQYIHHRDAFGLDTDTARLIRLFFQPVLIAWALWSTNALKWWKNRRS